MHETVRFILAGQVEEVNNCEPTRTVLEFLREDKGLKGTKEGCAEGDCGACTVVVGELQKDGVRYRAINSCIQFLATLDGKQLLTIEDLTHNINQTSAGLHAVQQAMLDQHGSQCGFCTPGFVMSLFAMYQNHQKGDVKRADIDLGLAGNLCRCTGYAPIVRAAEQALTASRSDTFKAEEERTVEQLKSIQSTDSLQISHANGHFFAPRTIIELLQLLQTHPLAVMVAGATDVGLWVTKQNRQLDTVIYLGAVVELKKIEDDGNYLSLGAAVSYTDATEAITARYPAFLPVIERIGAAQVRNAGTVGGNIANGSPIGDMPPGLIALGAKLVLRSTQGQRHMDLEDYFIDYGKQDLHKGECVEQILLPSPPADQIFATYKISKRYEQDISAVCGALSLQVKNGKIKHVRVCFGGMAATPKRATACEKALNGKDWNQQSINGAKQALLEDFTPITDMRASAQYRMLVAQNLLQRFFLEHTETPYPVRLGTRMGPAETEQRQKQDSSNG
jgi:xanthine dehydrogenase small subunit